MAVTSVNISSPLTGGTITSSGFVGINQADGSTNGYLSSSDWSTFNSKVGGSGTLNRIPKWATTSTLGNSLLIDNGTSVQVGTFTASATMVANSVTFLTQNVYASNGLYLNDVTATYNKQGIFPNSSTLEFYTSNTTTGVGELIAKINNTTSNYLFEVVKGFVNTAGTSINISGGIVATISNTSNYSFVNVTPTINQGVLGTGIVRGFYYAPPSYIGDDSKHFAWENTLGDIKFGNLTGSNTEAVTIDSTGKLVKQSTLSAINTYRFAGANGLQVDFLNTEYILGNTNAGKTALKIQSNHTHGIFGNITDGLSMTYSNQRYKFGQIDPTNYSDFFFYFRGNQERAYFSWNGIDNGLYVEMASGGVPTRVYILGDEKGINPNNANYIVVNDVTEGILLDVSDGDGDIEFKCTTEFSVIANSIELVGTNLTDPTTWTDKLNLCLVVTVQGTQYKIQLWRP